MSTPAAYCVGSGDTFVPTALARGPWGQAVAGHVVGGVLARAVERAAGDPEFQPSRLTVDLVRPTVLETVEVVVDVQRGGRRIRLVEASLIQGGAVAAKATALFLRRGEHPAGRVWSSAVAPPMPAEPDPLPVPILVYSYGWAAKGAANILPTEWAQATPGQKYAWVRHVTPLVEGESDTPFVCRAGRRRDQCGGTLGPGGHALHQRRLHVVAGPIARWSLRRACGAHALWPRRCGDRNRRAFRPSRPDRHLCHERAGEFRVACALLSGPLQGVTGCRRRPPDKRAGVPTPWHSRGDLMVRIEEDDGNR
jgi:hypothetical protein